LERRGAGHPLQELRGTREWLVNQANEGVDSHEVP
jgi:hypothetical protein